MKILLILLLLTPHFAITQLDSSFKNQITYSNGAKKKYPSLMGGLNVKNSGFAFITFGLVSQHRRPFLLFSKATQQIKEQRFLFSFDQRSSEGSVIEEFDRFFRGAQSPKEFLLLKLHQNERKDRRYLITEKSGWRTKIGHEAVAFSFVELEPGVFQVIPNQRLEEGEYCFVHQDILNMTNFANVAFFDFGIVH